jgi:murein DD-endopeptidase MepM/ murein hydrolase activator NlpD
MSRTKWFVWIACLWTLLAPACHRQEDGPGGDEPAVPEISSTPYLSDADVTFYRRFEPEHEGVDLAALRDIPIRAACSGTFRKELYYHPTSQRWQVNTGIWVGDYSVDGLFEPGAQVSQATGQAQFDALVADNTQVRAGELLGTLLLAPGNAFAIFHFGVHRGTTGAAECPLQYCSAAVRTQLQSLAQRDHPGWEVCVGQ